MNILVTGANGQLGNELRLCSKGSKHHFVFTDVNQVEGVEAVNLDITDKNAIKLVCDSEMIDVIINCAAYTNVEKAEDDTILADLLNHKAPMYLADVACERKASLVHISTDYVFNGNGCIPVSESQAPDPKSVYGRTKLAGENAVCNSGCNYVIIRTAWLYSPFGKNFVKTMQHLTEVNDEVKVVVDQVGTPTYAKDLAEAIMHIIETGQLEKKGIYHFSDEGAVSWYDFAQEICSLSGNKCDVKPCSSDQFPAKAARPHYSVLDKTKIKDTFGIRIPYWKESLVDCINRLK